MTLGDKLHDLDQVKLIFAIRYRRKCSVNILETDDKLVYLSHGMHEKQDRVCACAF